MAGEFQVTGNNPNALFTLTVHRGEGMALLAMDWKDAQPPLNFVGFAIEYREPNGNQFYPLKNRLTFDGNAGTTSSAKRPPTYSTRIAPIQKFRWVHFPRNAQLTGPFEYQVTPVFMGSDDSLSYGASQNAEIELGDETYPGVLNVAFTRGFISSQAFVDNFGDVDALLPAHSKDGLDFKPTDPDAEKAYAWMGFEARRVLMKALDDAIADEDADVGVVAYDFDLPEIIDRLKKLKGRVRVIIDNSDGHTGDKHAEDRAAQLLTDAGIPVVRQAMGSLQHNKTLYVNGPKVKRVICGSTNMSWRGLYVQSDNAVAIEGQGA
ncbi:MAG: phospholipase, partial [Alphaproteobacteria bacterium]|nr:phospholipase [Alphaproteobacteria bacterium]